MSRSSRRGLPTTVRSGFKGVYSGALVAGAANQTFTGNFGRLSNIGDNFMEYRVTSLKFRLHPNAALTGAQAVGFASGVETTNPSTVETVLETECSALLASKTTTPSAWVNVPKASLRGPREWYMANGGGSSQSDAQQFEIHIAGTGTDAYLVEIAGICEFRSPVNQTDTPQLRELRAAELALRARAQMEKRRLELLATLQGIPTSVLPASTSGK